MSATDVVAPVRHAGEAREFVKAGGESSTETDLFLRYKRLQRMLEMLDIQVRLVGCASHSS